MVTMDKIQNFKVFSLIYAILTFILCGIIMISSLISSKSKLMYEGDGSDLAVMPYEKGVYAIEVDYTSDCYGMVVVTPASDLDQWGASYANAFMPDYSNHVTSYLYVNQSGSQFEISVNPVQGDSYFAISHITVVRMGMRSATYESIRLFGVMLIIYLIISVIIILKKKDSNNNCAYLIVGLFLLTFISMIGFMQSYIPGGQDTEFHLARIASIAEGLNSGSFPVRIYSNFINDYGYPLGIMYGDLFLYPSAILHFLGMPLWETYVFYVAMISALTSAISCYSFGKMIDNWKIGLIGSVIYTLSIWRLNDVYIRAAAGEYAAMAFLPLVILGFYQLFSDKEDVDARKTFLYLGTGYFGLIQTHMLTSIVTTVFLVIIGLCLCKRVLYVNKILLIIKSATTAILANLCFIIPMLDYYKTYDLSVEHQSTNIQSQGAYLSQLFMTTGDYTGPSSAITDSYGIQGEMPLGIGLSMLLILAVLILVIFIDPNSRYRKVFNVCCVVAIVSIWMSSCYFPYDYISRNIGFVARIINRVQFPWRYSVVTTITLTVAAVFLLKYFSEKEKNYYLLASVVIVIVTVCQAISFISERLAASDYYIDAECSDQIAASLIDNDTLYWMQGMVREDLVSREIDVSSEDISATISKEKIPTWEIYFTNSSEIEGWIEPPILSFKGYHAYYEGQELEVSSGDNFRLRVEIPLDSEGVITIRFKEPFVWRLGEIISLITWIMILMYMFKVKKNKVQNIAS